MIWVAVGVAQWRVNVKNSSLPPPDGESKTASAGKNQRQQLHKSANRKLARSVSSNFYQATRFPRRRNQNRIPPALNNAQVDGSGTAPARIDAPGRSS